MRSSWKEPVGRSFCWEMFLLDVFAPIYRWLVQCWIFFAADAGLTSEQFQYLFDILILK